MPASDSLLTREDTETTEVPKVSPESPAGSDGCVTAQGSFANNSVVPHSTPCEQTCVCINGEVKCQLQACPSPPPEFLKCIVDHVEGKCCPSYDCRKLAV